VSNFLSAEISVDVSANLFSNTSLVLSSEYWGSIFYEVSLFGGSVSMFMGSIIVLRCYEPTCVGDTALSYPFISHLNVSGLRLSLHGNVLKRSNITALYCGASFSLANAVGSAFSSQIGHLVAAKLYYTVADQNDVMPLTAQHLSQTLHANTFNDSAVTAELSGANSFGCVYAGAVSINIGPMLHFGSEGPLYARVHDVSLLHANVSVRQNTFDNSLLAVHPAYPVAARISGAAFLFALGCFIMTFINPQSQPLSLDTTVDIFNVSATNLQFDLSNNSLTACVADVSALGTIFSTVLHGAAVSVVVGSFASSTSGSLSLTLGSVLLESARVAISDNSFARCYGQIVVATGQSQSQDAYGVSF
jgi:hypothetical protein